MEDLKIVIRLSGDRALIAVQGKDTDPMLQGVEASTLEQALGAVPTVVELAKRQWATSPKHPAYTGPPPTPVTAPAARTVTATAPKQDPMRPSML